MTEAKKRKEYLAAAIVIIDCARQIAKEATKIGPTTFVPTQLILDLREALLLFDKVRHDT
jgi:hypothetical protein